MQRPGRKPVLLAVAAVAAVAAAILAFGRSDPSVPEPAPAVAPRERALLDVRAVAAAISPDGRRCVTVDAAGRVSLWSCNDGKRLRRRSAAARSGRASISFTRDGLGILAGGGAAARVLDPGDLAQVTRLRGAGRGLAPVISPSAALAFRPRSAHLAEIVETGSGRRIAALPHIPDLIRARVTFSGDDRAVAVITRPRSWVTVFDSSAGASLNSFSLEAADASVALSADGGRLLIADGTAVRIMEVITGVERRRFNAPTRVTTVAFGVDERLVVTGDAAGVVRVWHAATGAPIAEYATGSGRVEAAALAADGRLLVTRSSGSPVVLDCPPCVSEA